MLGCWDVGMLVCWYVGTYVRVYVCTYVCMHMDMYIYKYILLMRAILCNDMSQTERLIAYFTTIVLSSRSTMGGYTEAQLL